MSTLVALLSLELSVQQDRIFLRLAFSISIHDIVTKAKAYSVKSVTELNWRCVV